MSMERWWNDTWYGRTRVLGEEKRNLSQYTNITCTTLGLCDDVIVTAWAMAQPCRCIKCSWIEITKPTYYSGYFLTWYWAQAPWAFDLFHNVLRTDLTHEDGLWFYRSLLVSSRRVPWIRPWPLPLLSLKFPKTELSSYQSMLNKTCRQCRVVNNLHFIHSVTLRIGSSIKHILRLGLCFLLCG